MNLYDFDKTIFYRDSGSLFCLYCLRRHPTLFPYMLKSALYAALWGLKIVSAETFKTAAFFFLKKIDAEKEAEAFWNEYAPERLTYYDGTARPDDVICSASPDFLVKAFFKKINPTATVIATGCDLKTGRIIGKNCKGQEKVVRLKELGYDRFDNVYSDSLSDLPILSLGSNAFLVKKGKPTPFEVGQYTKKQ